ncbi:MAG: tetratricopeptide repeat protein [Aggregatilineales bacterium]
MSDNRNTKTRRAENFIEVLVERTFQRVIRGDYSYDRDVRELRRYQKQAQKLDARSLEARILNCLAILQNVSGRSTRALRQFQEIYKLYEALDDKKRMASTLGNMASAHMTQGNYEEATAITERALALISAEDDYDVYRFLLEKKMSMALKNEDYGTVDSIYKRFQAILTEFGNDDKHTYAEYMSGVYQIMAEREMAREDYQQARRYINLATEFAEGLELTFGLAPIYCTQAHLALREQQDTALAEEYWQKMQDTLKGIHSPSHIGRDYIEEARYLQRHGYLDKAAEFAQRAISIFEQFEMPEDMALAGQLLQFIQGT